MNRNNNWAGENEDPVLAEALRNFKASVDAWSKAAYSRPRKAFIAARHTWRLAATVALACMVVAGSVTAAFVERHHQQEIARQAAIKATAQKSSLEHAATAQPPIANSPAPKVKAVKVAQPPAKSRSENDDDLLANVDSDISRQVPAAMEPLAQMMGENGSN